MTTWYYIRVKQRLVSATEFKSKCLSLLDEIEQQGGSITVTKRGRPVAVLGPVRRPSFKSPKGAWAGKVEIVGDIVNFDTSHLWDVASGVKQG